MRRHRLLAVLLPLLAVMLMAEVAISQTSPNFSLEWGLLNSGGSARQSANTQVQDTLGQWTSGRASSANARIEAGFWYGIVALSPTPTATSTTRPSVTPSKTPTRTPTATKTQHADSYIYPQPKHDAFQNSDAHLNGHPDAHADSYAHPRPKHDAFQNSDAHLNGHPDAHADSHAHQDTHPAPQQCAGRL